MFSIGLGSHYKPNQEVVTLVLNPIGRGLQNYRKPFLLPPTVPSIAGEISIQGKFESGARFMITLKQESVFWWAVTKSSVVFAVSIEL